MAITNPEEGLRAEAAASTAPRERRRRATLFSISLVVGVTLALFAAMLPPASQVEDVPVVGALAAQVEQAVGMEKADASVRYCGWVTCTDYSSRSEVRDSARRIRSIEGRIGDISSVTCQALSYSLGAVAYAITGPLGLVGGVAIWIGCGALRSKMNSITNTIKAAANNNQCVAISFARYGSNNIAFATGWYRYSCNWY